MHMHLGFASDSLGLARELESDSIAAFANTVTPDEFARLHALEEGSASLRIGLGLHPWWIDAKEHQRNAMLLTEFIEALPSTGYIGEIGLDFSPGHEQSKQEQIACFDQILAHCEGRKGLLISIHGVKAYDELLDMLESRSIFESSSVLLHSFGGSSDQLQRSISLGAFFSIGSRTLSTKRGREYARIIPADRLLLESDLPASEGQRLSAAELEADLAATLKHLATIRTAERRQLGQTITERSLALLDLAQSR